MPKISVIIPAYNMELYIEECLDSILSQTMNDIEVIVINDGSKDNTKKIIQDKMEKDNRIKLIDKENEGQGVARNVGLKKATGEYVAFIDADDWIKSNNFEVTYNVAIQNNSDIVIYNSENFYEDGKKIIRKEITNSKLDIKKAYMIATPGCINRLFRRSFLEKIAFEFPKNVFYEDIAIFPLTAAKADVISYVPEVLYEYRVRSGSTMNQKKNNKKLKDIFDVFEMIEKNTLDIKEQYHDELEYIYIRHLLHAASLRFIPYKTEDESIYKISDIIREKYPNWQKNIYFREDSLKYKIICNLIYKKKISLVRKLLRVKIVED